MKVQEWIDTLSTYPPTAEVEIYIGVGRECEILSIYPDTRGETILCIDIQEKG